jgi:hypothetical protein
VVWRYVPEKDAETGEVDWDKPPVNARTGGLASSTNAKTWSTFAQALAAYRRGNLDGLGLVLHRKPADDGHGPVGIDLDHCRDRATGEVTVRARAIIRRLNSYTEASPSGEGVRILVLGKLPPGRRKKGNVEMYETARYVTVTGQHISGTPTTVEHRQAELEEVHRRAFGDAGAKRGAEVHRPATEPLDLEDAEIIRRASEARNGDKFKRLWAGDLAGHKSASEADLALCNYLAFWCGPDEGRIADLFARSGLFRSKWQREDYRKRTIGRALEGRTEFYRPGRSQRGVQADGGGDGHGDAYEPPEDRQAAAGAAPPNGRPQTGYRWEPITSTDLAARDYRPHWLVQRLLVADQPAILGGPRKAMKTSLLVDLAVSLASATPFLGQFPVPMAVRVALLSGESGEYTLQQTAVQVCRARGLTLDSLGDRLRWQFRLPQLADPGHLAALGAGLKRDGIQVLINDPLYLSLLAGQGAGGARAENLYEVGPLLLHIASVCLAAGATPILAHHARKGTSSHLAPLDLDDLAFAGAAEFARQWLLVSRRERYEPGTGEHRLWLSAGGSVGHGGLWAVDISEGVVDEHFAGKRWEVSVQTAAVARQANAEERRADRRQQEARQDGEVDSALLGSLDRLDPARQGAGWNRVQAEARLPDTRMERAVNRLRRERLIEELTVKVVVGNGGRRPVRGLRRPADRDN